MKNISNKISLYWKCQLIGWAVFLATVTIWNELVWQDSDTFLPFAVSIYFFGLLFSHLMKLIIKKFGILNKRFAAQAFYLSIVSILFSFLATLIWMVSMNLLGFWKIAGETQTAWIANFMHGFYFHYGLVLASFSGWLLIFFLFHYVKGVRREEQLKTQYQLQMTELEAKALRAQMNPHFIFNCLNSIKSLMQQQEMEKGITYLTTFSKLIRTLFNNADKKEISLYDEIETCKLYLQLEAMRFDTKFSYAVDVDKAIDLKSIQLPALIIQPFIENAIWHGIVPRNSTGHISLNVVRNSDIIKVAIDDNGIGREASQQIKPTSNLAHQSKGVNLTQTRLELNNLLQQRQAKLEVIDKKDEHGTATGTTVIINIKEELS